MIVEEIFLSSEDRAHFFNEPPDGFTDVLVVLKNGDRFVSSFFSFEKIIAQRKIHQESEAFLSGNFFWSRNMILVDNCNRKTIKRVIDFMIVEGDFLYAFQKIN